MGDHLCLLDIAGLHSKTLTHYWKCVEKTICLTAELVKRLFKRIRSWGLNQSKERTIYFIEVSLEISLELGKGIADEHPECGRPLSDEDV